MKIVIEIDDRMWKRWMMLLRWLENLLFFCGFVALTLFAGFHLERFLYQDYGNWEFDRILKKQSISYFDYMNSRWVNAPRIARLWNRLSDWVSSVPLLHDEFPGLAEGYRSTEKYSSHFPDTAAKAERRLETFLAFHTNLLREHPQRCSGSAPPPTAEVSAKQVKVSAGFLEGNDSGGGVSTQSSTDPERTRTTIRSFGENLVGRLEIPRLGGSVIVFEGTQTSTLRKGVGLIENSAWPGENGNVSIAGHRDTSFRMLRNICQGDTVILSTLGGRFHYKVKWKAVVDPLDTEVLAATEQPSLTLVTCFPFEYIGPAPKRFIVRAVAVPAAPSTPALAGAVEVLAQVQESHSAEVFDASLQPGRREQGGNSIDKQATEMKEPAESHQGRTETSAPASTSGLTSVSAEKVSRATIAPGPFATPRR